MNFQTKIKFNMTSLTAIPVLFPPNYLGKWRLTLIGEFEDEGGKKECVRSYFDLIEV